MIERGTGGPQVRIEFQSWNRPTIIGTVRHWYHVPRIGDFVNVVAGEERIIGNVRSVQWNDDGDCTVIVDD